MFSSLDRVDLVYAGPDGRVRWLQSDHRRPAQIEAEAELSLLFAVIRLSDPRRDFPSECEPPVLEYRCQHMPPEFLRAAIAGAGAELVVDAPVPHDGIAPDPESLARLAFTALAARVARERGVPCDLAGLARLEREQPTLTHDAEPPDDDGAHAHDEVTYWRAVVQLAAFAGEVLRTTLGGAWHLDLGEQAGVLPFVFIVAEEPAIDLLAAAMDRVEGIDETSLRTRVEAALASASSAQSR